MLYYVIAVIYLFIKQEENKKLDKIKIKIKSRKIYKRKIKIKYKSSSIL